MIEALFHIATKADWEAAKKAGEYTTATRGRSLAEEGFIHAAQRDQVMGVYRRYYADLDEPLVLLHIDPRKMEAEIKLEKVVDQRYPHIYGPIPVAAVTAAPAMTGSVSKQSDFSKAFLAEMLTRVAWAFLAMACAFLGWLVAKDTSQWGPFVGAIGGLAIGILLATLGSRWLRRR